MRDSMTLQFELVRTGNTGKKMEHYKRSEVKQLVKFIQPLLEDGYSHQEIANMLNHAGITTANDKKWTGCNLSWFIRARKKKFPKSAVDEKSIIDVKNPKQNSVVEALMTDPLLNDKQKVSMLMAYLNS